MNFYRPQTILVILAGFCGFFKNLLNFIYSVRNIILCVFSYLVTLYEEFYRKLADEKLAAYLSGEISFQDAKEYVKQEEQKWIRKAKRFALYDDQPYRMK